MRSSAEAIRQGLGVAGDSIVAFDTAALVQDCQKVVRVPSLSGEENAVAGVVAAMLGDLGFDEVSLDAKGNVIGLMRGTGGGRSIMVNGHLDHVPPGSMLDPFSAKIVDAARWGEIGPAIYGRGTCDMKCNVVASAYAIAAVRRTFGALSGDIIFVADVGEEVDSPDGIPAVLAAGLTADAGLSTESTRQRVYLGHRGKLDVQYRLFGRTAHASEPASGRNAIDGVPALVESLIHYGTTMKSDAILGSATVAPFSVKTEPDNGTAVIPDLCKIRVDRRYVRGETAKSVEGELRRVAESALGKTSDAWDLSIITHYPLMYTDLKSPIVQTALTACIEPACGEGGLGAWRFGVNGTFMAAAGIPTVGIGPGDERWAHTPDEHVLIADLEHAVRIWSRLLIAWCGPERENLK